MHDGGSRNHLHRLRRAERHLDGYEHARLERAMVVLERGLHAHVARGGVHMRLERSDLAGELLSGVCVGRCRYHQSLS